MCHLCSLTSIYLSILCKTDDIKRFGYSAVLEPLLKDLVTLEEEGIYISSLSRQVKGTVFCVVADNLGAHSIGGFVESFSSSHCCRFCLGERSQFKFDAAMSQPAKLRIILQDHDIRRLELPSGIPDTVDELHSLVQQTFQIEGSFTLHFKDADFGEIFLQNSVCDVKDKDTLKVVHVFESPMVILTNLDSSCPSGTESAIYPQSDSCSSGSQDTVILSSPEHMTHRSQCWPVEFTIPRFAYNTELVLASGNEAFEKEGILLSPTAILPDMLEKLAETIYQYVAYPTSVQLNHVAEALIQKHPCLREPGSFNRCYGWQQRLKYKIANYRCKLRTLGCPELVVNSLKKKRAHEMAAAKNVKKPRKAEVNYLPPHPQGETEESLEQVRLDLLSEVKKRTNSNIISEKMARTFSIRRQEVVNLAPHVDVFKERWPALFDVIQIREEFKRITTINLEASFMAKLDQYCPKLMNLVSSRGGAAKMKIQQIKDTLLEDNTIERRREVAIRCMVVYLGEKEEDLFKEYLDAEALNRHLAGEVMKIMVNKAASTSDPASATIVIEGTEVLRGLDLPRACALLMGLIYALNLSYPRQLRHTFEVFQKLLLELDGLKASPKVMSLKQKLLS
ncbi:sterile alpha motif domain-containing protein 3-like [Trichomycterus rosablanca]|uniref:sterile alpha motif domain-containing protein 3-like n=1 Tax=Trichomycterus rosablanca TaxID=2290929 RepID=UPI002F354089